MDPHKRTATIEIMAGDEAVAGRGRYGTDAAGYAAMLAEARRWPERMWAIEGCQGIGRHIANRLLADGEQVAELAGHHLRSAYAFSERSLFQEDRERVVAVDDLLLLHTDLDGRRHVINEAAAVAN